jgi:hypothetical protein
MMKDGIGGGTTAMAVDTGIFRLEDVPKDKALA